MDDSAGIKAVLSVRHKNGHEHTISVGSHVWSALERLRTRGGSANSSTMHEALAVVGLHAGRLRHTFATLALTAGQLVHPAGTGGLSRATVAEALGHSPATNRRYYDGVAVPPMVVVPLRLRHSDDPAVGGEQ